MKYCQQILQQWATEKTKTERQNYVRPVFAKFVGQIQQFLFKGTVDLWSYINA